MRAALQAGQRDLTASDDEWQHMPVQKVRSFSRQLAHDSLAAGSGAPASGMLPGSVTFNPPPPHRTAAEVVFGIQKFPVLVAG